MNQDRNISAAFSINSYDLTLSSNLGGSVEGAGSYIFNSLISISANPVHGYSFLSWSGDGVTNPLAQNNSLTMNQDRNISAAFSINSYDLTLSSNSGGTVEGAGSYTFNSLASISANPVEGYSFSSWSGEGVTNSLVQNTSVTMNQDRNISAAFSINSYDLGSWSPKYFEPVSWLHPLQSMMKKNSPQPD